MSLWYCGFTRSGGLLFFWIKVNFDASLRILMFLFAVLRFLDPPLRPSIILSFSDGHKKIRMHVDVVEIPQRLPVNCWLFWQRMSEFYRMQCFVLDRSSNVQYSTEYSSVFNQFPFSQRRLCGLLKLVFAILFKSVKSVCLILKHTPLNPDIV